MYQGAPGSQVKSPDWLHALKRFFHTEETIREPDEDDSKTKEKNMSCHVLCCLLHILCLQPEIRLVPQK